MSRAAICLLVLVLIPSAFAAHGQSIVTPDIQVQTTVTTPDGSQVQVQRGIGDVQGGVIVGGVPVPAGRGQAQPTRDTRPSTGNSRIRGRVLVADTMQPARRATVRVSAPEMRDTRTATTDLDGRYEVANLPAGRYSINASKNSFIGLSYGQTRPTIPAQTLALAEKQNADGVDLVILRGGAITGRIVDDFGEPISGVPVMAMRAQFQQGQLRLMPFGQRATTNDIGEYRLFALPGGAYYVGATPQAFPPTPQPSPAAAQALQIVVNAMPEERTGFAPVFYPGATDPLTAAKVTVAAGQTVSEINFALVGTRLSQVSGMAVDSQGRPMTAGNVSANRRGRVQGLPSYSGQLRADGSFVIPNMPPGDYTLRANQRQQPTPPSPPGTPRPAPPRPEVAIGAVSVSGSDVSGIRIAPPTPATVSGRVVFDSPSAAQSLKASTIRLNATALANPTEEGGAPAPAQNPPPMLKEDFTFDGIRLNPGFYMLRPGIPGPPPTVSPTGAPSPVAATQPVWVLKSLRVNGTDVTNTGVELRPGDNVTGVEIEMTNRPPQISGTVTAGNEPAVGFSVILFAQDRELWPMPGPGLSAMMRTDQSGQFSTRNLRPGRYYALAVYELEPGASGDPEFLLNAISRATAFTLADGETKTLDLRGQAR